MFRCMVWCGVVWCGVVWCGVVWCGVVWCGVVWCGVVWCGVVWCGVVWCGVVWCGVVCELKNLQTAFPLGRQEWRSFSDSSVSVYVTRRLHQNDPTERYES